MISSWWSYLSVLFSYGHFLAVEKINDFGEDDWQTVLYGQVGKASAEQGKIFRLTLPQGCTAPLRSTTLGLPGKTGERSKLPWCFHSHRGKYSRWCKSARTVQSYNATVVYSWADNRMTPPWCSRPGLCTNDTQLCASTRERRISPFCHYTSITRVLQVPVSYRL